LYSSLIYIFWTDEATSALDPTSRILVFEALKRWRKNKTTIVITHDLSQIEGTDFVYVLKGGRVVEQGFRVDLETEPPCEFDGEVGPHEGGGKGEFREMVEAQRKTGGFLPERSPFDSSSQDAAAPAYEDDHDEQDDDDDDDDEAPHDKQLTFNITVNPKHQSLARPAMRPLTLGNWMFDVVADLTRPAAAGPSAGPAVGQETKRDRDTKRISRFVPIAPEMFTGSLGMPMPMEGGIAKGRRPSSVQVLPSPTLGITPTPGLTITIPESAHTIASRRLSLQFTPTSPTFRSVNWGGSKSTLGASKSTLGSGNTFDEEEEKFEEEKWAVERSGSHAVGVRGRRVRRRWDDDEKISPLTSVQVDKTPSDQANLEQRPSLWPILREAYPTMPCKPLLFLGLLICLANGAMTPLFSYLLSQLQFQVATGGKDVSAITFFGGLVLGVAALDGLFMGLKYFLMETAGNAWVLRIRQAGFGKVLAQDKRWFDKSENASVKVVQTLVKDGDDARNLVAVVMGQGCVVLAMVGVGLVWAMVRGWQLTMVGVGLAPIFSGVMALQAVLVGRCELRNKRAREEVAKGYYDVGFASFCFDVGADFVLCRRL
jgi:ATP-binding cassette, subfamily B (MDR/TAP), member 1